MQQSGTPCNLPGGHLMAFYEDKVFPLKHRPYLSPLKLHHPGGGWGFCSYSQCKTDDNATLQNESVRLFVA